MDASRKITRDKVVSLTNKGVLVGVYYADTDGTDILLETTPEKADALIKRHNANL